MAAGEDAPLVRFTAKATVSSVKEHGRFAERRRSDLSRRRARGKWEEMDRKIRRPGGGGNGAKTRSADRFAGAGNDAIRVNGALRGSH